MPKPPPSLTVNAATKVSPKAFSGIQASLIGLILLVLVPIIVFQGYFFYEHYQQRRDAEFQANLELARAVAKTFDAFVQSIVHQQLTIGSALTRSPMTPEEMGNFLGNLQDEHGIVKNYSWISPQGRVVASRVPEIAGLYAGDRHFFLELLSGKEWHVGDLVESRHDGKPVICITSAIRDEEKRLLGIVLTSIFPEKLGKMLAIERSQSGAFSIVDSKGMLVYRYPAIELSWEKRNWLKALPYLFGEALSGREAVHTIFAILDGRKRIAAATPIPSIGWAAAASRAEDETLGPIFSDTVKSIFLFILIALASFAAAFALSRKIASSIAAIRNHALSLGRGETENPFVASGPAELKDLADAFNMMRDKVQSRESALRDSEQRVRLKLESVLSPEGDLGSLELSDIIDAPAIQSLMDAFYKIVPIPMSIIDLKGNVLVGVGWQEICVGFHRANPETCRHCIESDTQLSAGIPPGESKLYKCKNNMWDIATPIIVGGRHMGNVFSGQFFFDDDEPDYELFRSQAKQYGFSQEEYIKALKAVPRLSRELVANGMAFFMKLSQVLSQLSYSNIKLARSLAERDSLMDLLRKSEQELNRAQAVARTGSWRMDVKRNELLWSDEAHRIFGIAKGIPLTYESFLSTVHPEDREYVDRVWADALRGKPYNIEHRIVVGDAIKWVGEKAELEFDMEGTLLGGFGTVQDITERKVMEEELRKSRDELELRVQERTAELKRSNQALKDFASIASHDLQEPLRKVVSFGSRLGDQYGSSLGDEGKDFLQRMISAAERMQRLLDALLDYSRVSTRAEPPRKVSLKEVAREVLSDLETRIEQTGGMVEIGDLPIVEADPIQMRQLFQNLIGNGLKYHGEEKPHVRVYADSHNGDCQIYVEDNGIGFDEEHLDKIFKPFHRLHGKTSKFEGTGMGLAICKKIVERHGWTITARSAPGHGATFVVTLSVKR